MKIFKKINSEIQDFSKWFRVLFYITAVIYLILWLFTINLSAFQKANGINPVLPGAPKDSIEYIQMTDSLFSGKGLAINDRIETLRGPGYPLFAGFIKTIGGSYFAVTLVQIFLVFLSAIFIRRLGIVFKDKKVGELASTLFLINPVTMVLSLIILTDVLFLFLFTLGVFLSVSITDKNYTKNAFWVSLVFIFAIYVRGMGIFAIPILIAPFFTSNITFKLKLKTSIIIIVVMILSTIPWIIRNYKEAGVASFSSFRAVQFAWVIPNFLADINHTSEVIESRKLQEATGVPEEEWYSRGLYDIKYSKQIISVTDKIILDHPFTYIRWHVVSTIPFLFPSSILFMRDAYDSAINYNRPFKYGAIHDLTSGDFKAFLHNAFADWWKVAERLCWFFGILLSLIVVWKERKKPLLWVFVFIPAYLMLLSGPAAGPRLSFQAWPYMFILISTGIVYFFNIYKSWKNNKIQ